MKKLLLAAAFLCAAPVFAFAQSYSSPIFAGVTLQNPLAVTSGGTGGATASAARSALSAASNGANTDITSLGGLTTPLSASQGGTGASSLSAAFDNAYCSTVGYMLVRYTGVWTCAKGVPANPVWWGADPTGTTSSTAAFNSAAAASAYVQFPPGTFLFSTAPTAISTPITIEGSGRLVTTLETGYATGDLLDLTGGLSTVERLGFSSTVTRTSGAYIEVANSESNLYDLYTNKAFVGEMYDSSCTLCVGRDINNENLTPSATQAGSAGIIVGNAGTSPAIAVMLDDIMQSTSGGDPTYGIDLVSADSTIISNVEIIYAAAGALEENPGTGAQVIHTLVTNSFFDTSGEAFIATPTGTAIDYQTAISNTWLGDSGYGIYLGGTSTGATNSVSCINCRIDNNTIDGVAIANAGWTNTYIGSSCLASDVVGFGFSVAGQSSVSLMGNHFGNCDGLGSNTTADIYITTGSTNSNNQVIGNYLSSTTKVSGSFTGTTNWAIDNIGYNPVTGLAAPSFPASGTAVTNPFPYPVTILLYGGTVSAISVGSTAIFGTITSIPLGVGQSITLTYSSAPSWVWLGS